MGALCLRVFPLDLLGLSQIRAANQAGFSFVRVIEEPIAAAIAYGLNEHQVFYSRGPLSTPSGIAVPHLRTPTPPA